ncbi:hypothetical protein TNCV_1954611 [Trichonephila clavipes]|nr:hypothetical protein TNCV_1954611 [Trichonephila clavipes]
MHQDSKPTTWLKRQLRVRDRNLTATAGTAQQLKKWTKSLIKNKESRGSRARHHDHLVPKMVTKNDANLAPSPRFCQVPI